jgi:hypothetical protein
MGTKGKELWIITDSRITDIWWQVIESNSLYVMHQFRSFPLAEDGSTAGP